jgi:hypothetical protein
MRFIVTSILIISFFAVSCSDQKDELYNKVMEVHDEIMPKMGPIMKYKKQLKDKIEALQKEENDSNDETILELGKAVDALDNSYEDMMGWMRQFDNDFDGMVEKEVMDYLSEQKNKIEGVGKTTNTALKNAEELLGI